MRGVTCDKSIVVQYAVSLGETVNFEELLSGFDVHKLTEVLGKLRLINHRTSLTNGEATLFAFQNS